MDLFFRRDTHYWTDTNGMNIHIGSCYTDRDSCTRESTGQFISNILLQEFPEMEPSNAMAFGQDLADEIMQSINTETGNGTNEIIRIEWSSMALVFVYKETGPDETIPIMINERNYNIHKGK